jgi:hypothetical protein
LPLFAQAVARLRQAPSLDISTRAQDATGQLSGGGDEYGRHGSA